MEDFYGLLLVFVLKKTNKTKTEAKAKLEKQRQEFVRISSNVARIFS